MLKKIEDIIPCIKEGNNKLMFYREGKLKTVKFKDLYKEIYFTALNILQLGIKKDEVIGIIGLNSYEFILIDLACIFLVIRTIYFDPIKYSYKDYTNLSKNHNFTILITDEKIDNSLLEAKVFLFSNLCNFNKKFEYADITSCKYDKEDIITYKFSSGSTGVPKMMAALTRGIEDSLNEIQKLFKHNEKDRILVVLPLHLLQQRYWVYSAALFNFDVIITTTKYIIKVLQDSKPTIVMGVPYIYEFLYKEYIQLLKQQIKKITLQEFFGGNIKYLWSGSAPISQILIESYFENNILVYHGYGTSETCIVSKNFEKYNKIGSSGKILDGRYIKFTDKGEILVKSDNPICKSYLNCTKDENLKVFLKDNYINTGDIGYLDNEGYLYINGREKNIIVLSNGKKIFPELIEKLFEGIAGIESCYIHGDGKPYLVALFTLNVLDIIDIHDQIRSINSKLENEKKIFKYLLLNKTFSINEGTLLNQGKKNRKAIYTINKHLIEDLYEKSTN